MMISIKRAGLSAGVLALIGAGACSNKAQPDESLKNDLALVSSSNRPQVVVSAIELGQPSAPERSAPKRAPKVAPRPAAHVALKKAPAPVQQAPVVEAPTPEPARESAPTPKPAPVQTQAPQDHRVYKTEGEIFRQMPWIRP